MAQLILNALNGMKSYNFAVDAIEEMVQKLLLTYAEIDAQLVTDGTVLTDKVDEYVEMMGEGYDLAQAKIDLGLNSSVDEPDYDVPSLPEKIFIEIPAFNLAIDLKQTAEDFVTLFNAASRKITVVFENLSFIKTLNDRFDDFLDGINIPFTENLTYVMPVEVPTGTEPDDEWILDMWFEYVKNETTDVWSVVGVGEDFTPDKGITVLIIWKAIVYWKVFKIIYNVAKKFGVIDLAKRFAGKVMKIPSALFNRYSMNKRLRKTAALTTVQVALAMKPELAVVDAVVDGILSDTSAIKVDIDDISKKFANYSAYG